ncbi:MAG: hydroxysqualene dehydroxylase HpnE [Planctomycetota bacterium]|nr:hydroxysqualene dehydroxylase HpnE [Planctomycetota bacterium]
MDEKVIVIGGGFAGLAAAQSLSRKGQPVMLLERKPHLGGRAYSFVDKKTGDEIDNGQHFLMGCYTETLSFLKEIGSTRKLYFQPNLRIDFLDPERGRSSLACPPLPAPFHVLFGILRMRSLSVFDRLSSLLLGWGMARSALRRNGTDRETAIEWLRSAGQSEGIRSRLWDIVTLATLNERPERASAKLLVEVIRQALLSDRSKSRMVISRVGLSSLYTDDARRAIESKGGSVRSDASVQQILFDEGKVRGVRLAGGETIAARSVISAVPAPALSAMLPEKVLERLPAVGRCRDLKTSPILSVNVWFDRPLLSQPFVGLHGVDVQWIFNKDKIHSRGDRMGHFLSFVVSNATSFLDRPREEILGRVLSDLRRLIPEAKEAKVLHSVIVMERDATISQTPDTDSIRPGPVTPYRSFFLSGDWTDTGLPATIEGAVRSGRRAARICMEEH